MCFNRPIPLTGKFAAGHACLEELLEKCFEWNLSGLAGFDCKSADSRQGLDTRVLACKWYKGDNFFITFLAVPLHVSTAAVIKVESVRAILRLCYLYVHGYFPSSCE